MDYAIDESVLRVSLPPVGGGECSAEEVQEVLDWLDGFRAHSSDRLAIDDGFAIWATYEQLGETNYGLLVLREKLDRQAFRRVPVQESVHGYVVTAGEWGHLDEHRRRLLAVAQHRPAEITMEEAGIEARCIQGRPWKI